MQSLVQILVVGPQVDREYNGFKFKSQEAECVLLNDDFTPAQVGVLRLSDAMQGEKAPRSGVYQATFSLRPNRKNRVIEAYVTNFTPVPQSSLPRVAAGAAK